ncbi:MAG TPA: nucleotidyltransferase family protein [Ktedonobacteraceae bacterium]|nr:nucleotidyltransferase family protein [Ktedonobacteraceae bacterium]
MLRTMRLQSGASLLQGCLPLLLQEVPADRLTERIGIERYKQLQACYREMCLLNLWYGLEQQQVFAALNSANIPLMVLKGADIAMTCYPQPDLRYFDDVDLMVRPEDLAATMAILERLGYSYHQEYRFEEISGQRSGFVYAKLVAAGYVVFEVHTAPHANELGVTFNVADLWQRARPVTLHGVQVHAMGPEDLLLFLCWHYRSHFFERLIWLYDVAILLLAYGSQLDWNLLYHLARRQGMLASIYYALGWCQQLFDVVLPPEAQLERFAPPRYVQWLITHLIGEDTATVLRPSMVSERKMLQHLMVDNLKSLGLAELRAIFPSPTHLGRLYMEHSRFPLRFFWLYYFLHPFVALKQGWRIVMYRRRGSHS